MRNYIKKIILPVIFTLSVFSLEATVRLPYLLSDGMVVQKNTPVKLWGWAEANEEVKIKVSGEKKQYTAIANERGEWEISLPPLAVGGPYTFHINDKKIEDVLCGSVYLCAGQSNMELQVSRVMDMFAEEINGYENTNIRYLKVPYAISFHGALDNIGETQWKKCDAENVSNYAALPYFFAREFNNETGEPVGIINASWGGTPIESWSSTEAMQKWPENIIRKSIYEDDDYREQIKNMEYQNSVRWNGKLYTEDKGLHATPEWYQPFYDDEEWENVDLVTTRWGLDTERDQNVAVAGSHWLRKNITLDKSQTQGEAILRLGCIEGSDSTFVNGVFVGSVGYQYPPRIYKLKEGILKEGDNVITIRVINGGGEAKVVPEKPYKLFLNNGEEINLEGRWKHRIGARMPKAVGGTSFQNFPVVLFDGMIQPLFNYPVEGIIWYQGESNIGNRQFYAEMLIDMIQDWRKGYDKEVPFYIVELADHLSPDNKWGRQAWAEMRQQQGLAAKRVPNAYRIRNRDVGEWNDIHPQDKKTPALRIVEAIKNNSK